MSDSGVKFRRRKSSDFPRLLLRERETGRHVTVREKVLGERRTGEMVTEVYHDEDTGEELTRTVELIEKTVEHEVNFQRRVETICTHYTAPRTSQNLTAQTFHAHVSNGNRDPPLSY